MELPPLGPQLKSTVIRRFFTPDAEHTIRFIVNPHQFYCNVKWDHNGYFYKNSTGPVYHIFDAIVSSIKANYSIAIPHVWTTGSLGSDGHWTGSLAPLEFQDADFSTGPFFPTQVRVDAFQVSVPYWWEECRILGAQKSFTSSNVFGYVNIFSWKAWMLILASLIALALETTIIEKILRGFRSQDESLFPMAANRSHVLLFFRHIFNFFAQLVWQGLNHLDISGSNAIRILIMAWSMSVMILMNVFCGQVRASLLIQSGSPRLENAEAVIAKPKLIPYLWLGSAYMNFLQTSSSLAQRQILNRSYEMQSQRLDSELFIPARLIDVLTNRGVIISDMASIVSGVVRNCKHVPRRLRQAKFYLGGEPIVRHLIAFLMQKHINQRTRKLIDSRITSLIEAGLVRKWYIEAMGDMDSCEIKSTDSAARPMAVEDVQSLLLILAFSQIFSITALMCECCRGRWERRKRKDDEEASVVEDFLEPVEPRRRILAPLMHRGFIPSIDPKLRLSDLHFSRLRQELSATSSFSDESLAPSYNNGVYNIHNDIRFVIRRNAMMRDNDY